MKIRTAIAVFATFLLAASTTGRAEILKVTGYAVDLTDPAAARAKATWSDPEGLTISPEGLGCDGDGASYRDGWIETKPIAVGESWRPTDAVHVRVSIYPPPREVTLASGQKSMPQDGEVYIRYSADLKHWSSWQVLPHSEPQSRQEKQDPGRYFSGTARVPYREQAEYRRLVLEYSRLDVPWKSDEEAAVRWIVGRDPEFFVKQIPFIGYLQLLVEHQFRGGQRIKSVQAEVTWGISGIVSPWDDESVFRGREGPWRYEDRRDVQAKPAATTEPADGGSMSPRAKPIGGTGGVVLPWDD